jgi:probable HAF family extracellular repeat protein
MSGTGCLTYIEEEETMLRRYLPLVVVASLAVPGGAAWAFSAFVDLSATDGYTQAAPTGVAAGGVAVLQGELSTTYPTLFYHTFLYPGASDGAMSDITSQFTGVARIGSTNMNGSGQFIACQTSPAGSTGGWIYSGGGATSLAGYSSSGETYGVAINNIGAVGGYYRATGATSNMSPYISAGGTYYTLNNLAEYGASVLALNTSGQAAGWGETGSGSAPDATVWTYTVSGGTMSKQAYTDIGEYGLANPSLSGAAAAYPSVQSSLALAVNASGQVLVAASNTTQSLALLLQNGVTATFLYNMSTETFTSLGNLQIYDAQTPTGTGTQFGGHAEAINDSGEVVGRIATSSGGYDAALWQNGTVTDLNKLYAGILPAGFTLNNATAIDDQGDIAGYGTDASNNTNQAFVIYAPTPGDANLDGRVDVNDLTIVLSHFGQSGLTWAQGDFIGDGKVDVNDLTILLSNFGHTTAPAAGAPSAVPEPCTLALLTAALAGLFAFAWRKHW